MDTAKWPQEASRAEAAAPTISERKIRRRNDIQKQLNCPRCNSNNTKFCYYNNYSLTQPRHFCKTCRRYWTAGGSLRNIPVGGGSRKNKRSLTATSSSEISSSSMQNPRFDFADQARDLSLGFQQVGGNLMHEVFGFQVGAGAPVKHDEGRVLFGSSVARGGVSEQNRGEGGDVQGFWNGMMGNIGGNNW